MKSIVIVVTVLVVLYLGAQTLTMFKVKSDLGDRVERALDSASDSPSTAKQNLVQEAQKLGIKLDPELIFISAEDTDVQSYAQRVVGNSLGAKFKNKHVVITVQYTAHLAGVPISQEVIREGYRQVAAPVMPPSKAAQEVLDSQ